MRRVIIDTDTGTDDAVAIIMALRDETVKVEAITTVQGNVDVDQATNNALVSVEIAGTYQPPVYKGMADPIFVEPARQGSADAHGVDGLGDIGLERAKIKEEDEHAVDFLIRYIEENPNELEIFTIGPVTNLAMVALKSPGTLKKVKKIYMMMGTGLWLGNRSPLCEGNVGMDPHALDIVFRKAGCPMVLIGWDICIHEYIFNEDDMKYLYDSGSKIAKVSVDMNQTLVNLNGKRFGIRGIDWADPAAMAVALDPGMIEESIEGYHRVECNTGLAHGCISIDWSMRNGDKPNAVTVTKVDAQRMKKCVMDRII